MARPEDKIVAKIRKELEARGCLTFKNWGSIYAARGFCDLTVINNGKVFFIEVKDVGKKPKPDQCAMIERLVRHGANADWCDSVEGALKIVFPN